MTKDPWTDPDPQPRDLDADLASLDPRYVMACSPLLLTVQAARVCRSPRASSQVWATSAGVR